MTKTIPQHTIKKLHTAETKQTTHQNPDLSERSLTSQRKGFDVPHPFTTDVRCTFIAPSESERHSRNPDALDIYKIPSKNNSGVNIKLLNGALGMFTRERRRLPWPRQLNYAIIVRAQRVDA